MVLPAKNALVLPPRVVREVVASAFDELRVPVGAPPEQVATTFRIQSLQRALGATTSSSNSNNKRNDNNSKANNGGDNSLESFQRQAVAFRFLSSLPLLDETEYRPEHMLATLRPLTPANGEDANERVSAMLDVAIASMEQAQRTWGLPYTNYVITVHYWMRTHVVRRRYSEFLALHRALERKVPIVPELPPRVWQYKLRVPHSDAARAQALTQYLMRVITSLAARGLFSLDIMDFLDIDYRSVRAEEEALAVSYLTHASGSSDRGYYIICSGWLDAWKRFVQSTSESDPAVSTSSSKMQVAPPPGKISNDHLIDPTTQSPKTHLTPARHYRCVNALTWQYLARVYGVHGPVLTRTEPSIYSKCVLDAATAAVQLQALVRGFLGRCAARRRRAHVQQQLPMTQQRIALATKQQALDERMAVVRTYVRVREYQVRHVAAMKIQRAFRVFVLRAEHQLLLTESAVPQLDIGSFERIDEYLSLEEIGLLPNDPRVKLAHFLVTLRKGVPIQKVRSRRKRPQWRLFQLNPIGSQLLWRSTKRAHALAFIDIVRVTIEAPVVLKTALGRRKASAGCAYGVVVTYRDNTIGSSSRDSDPSRSSDTSAAAALRELILVCESACECEALHFGLLALVTETQSRVANGASYVDGHGAIRKKVPHAKRLLRDAQELLDQQVAPTTTSAGVHH